MLLTAMGLTSTHKSGEPCPGDRYQGAKLLAGGSGEPRLGDR